MQRNGELVKSKGIKNKEFTFVQSEIDAEVAKNILYSDTGFAGNGVGQQVYEGSSLMQVKESRLGREYRVGLLLGVFLCIFEQF